MRGRGLCAWNARGWGLQSLAALARSLHGRGLRAWGVGGWRPRGLAAWARCLRSLAVQARGLRSWRLHDGRLQRPCVRSRGRLARGGRIPVGRSLSHARRRGTHWRCLCCRAGLCSWGRCPASELSYRCGWQEPVCRRLVRWRGLPQRLPFGMVEVTFHEFNRCGNTRVGMSLLGRAGSLLRRGPADSVWGPR
jgi:hypothetical protein